MFNYHCIPICNTKTKKNCPFISEIVSNKKNLCNYCHLMIIVTKMTAHQIRNIFKAISKLRLNLSNVSEWFEGSVSSYCCEEK